MGKCIGFVVCESQIADNLLFCAACWKNLSKYKKGRRLRSEFVAANRNFKGSKLYKESFKKVRDYLCRSLKYGKRRRENIKQYTIVG
jgi:hypothetical protein